MNLCYNGYRIVAPNYPMSFGYGKSHYNASLLEAVEDLRKWKQSLLKYDLPLYCLSSSSGNILMEALMSRDSDNVSGVASLFGTYQKDVAMASVPALYVLGVNDPTHSFQRRNSFLTMAKSEGIPIHIKTYPDEGHWFRKRENMITAVSELLSFFCRNP